MRAAALCWFVVALLLTGCIRLDVTPIPAGEQAGVRYATLQPLKLYGAYGDYPEKTITGYFLSVDGIANRYHTYIGEVPAGTQLEIVDLLDRTALGVPHSRIYRVRVRRGAVGSFGTDLVHLGGSPRLLRKNPDGTVELSRDFFRRID